VAAVDGAAIAQLLNKARPEHREIIERLVEILEKSGKNLDAAIKWKQLTYALDSDFHHWICSIATTKASVGLNFHFGGLLEDPEGVFQARVSKFLRKIEYRAVKDIDEKVILNFLEQALDRLLYFKTNWKAIQLMSK
jgi:hypothetical protein